MAEADFEGVAIVEHPFKNLRLRGLYSDRVITINSSIEASNIEKICIIAEELGHHHTSIGNILDQKDIRNRKQELRARRWAHEYLVPLEGIVEAFIAGVKGRYEIAEFLSVTEAFLQEAIDRYTDRFGLCVKVDEYIVYFDPLCVGVMFE
jgi:hypothetical protein